MKALNDLKQHLVLLFVVLFMSSALVVARMKTNRNSNHHYQKQHRAECPSCGLQDMTSNLARFGTSRLNCKRFYVKSRIKNDSQKNWLASYKCQCDFVKTPLDTCKANSSINMQQNNYQSRIKGDCLLVHVGMAVRGHNLLYRKWINKEDCFNQCLKTRIKNGNKFDCASFEHWHRDCDSHANTSENDYNNNNNNENSNNKLCASFNYNEKRPGMSNQYENPYNRNYFKQNRYYYKDDFINSKLKFKLNRKRASRTDICVLSNQTVKLAGDQFLPNNVVTYYELLCDSDIEDINQPNEQFKEIIPRTTVSNRNNNSNGRYKNVKNTTIPIPSSFNYLLDDSPDQNEQADLAKQKPGKQCQFNPCVNGGACILIDTYRFTCLCKEFYYGAYCELVGVQTICHKTLMEIIMNNQMAKNLNIKPKDMFINKKTNQLTCQLQTLNSTHSRFSIPFGMCSTLKLNRDGEIVYLNKLYSKVGTTKSRSSGYILNRHNFLLTLECTVNSNEETTTPILPVERWNLPLDSITKDQSLTTISTVESQLKKSCLIDLFELRMRIFYDNSYRNEYPSFQSHVSYNQKMNVQFFVEYSERLNELYQMQERLQYLHLTLLHCWLTSTKDPFNGVEQMLVENGCPQKEVHFFDSSLVKNSIQFSFNILKPVTNEPPKQYFLHCDPEICTEPPANKNNDEFFFRRFKSCQNISKTCEKKKNSQDYALPTLEFNPTVNKCNSMLIQGPLYIDETNDGFKAGQISSAKCLNSFVFLEVVLVLISMCF